MARWLVALVVAGCGGSTMIDSQRVAPPAAPIAAFDVLSQVGARGELVGAAFAATLEREAAACGVRATVTAQPSAAAVLVVTWDGSNKDRYGSMRSLRYQATLFEAATHRVWWHADLSLTIDTRSSTERPAAALARDLLARLRRDRVTPACAASSGQPLGADHLVARGHVLDAIEAGE